MIFPLPQKTLIRGCAEHKADNLGCAGDYVANYVEGVAPFDADVYWFGGPNDKGGDWMGFLGADGTRLEVAHLSKRYVPDGTKVKARQKCFKTGNTGTQTTGPHLHLQIKGRLGQRIDPESIQWTLPTNLNSVIQKIVNQQKKKLEDLMNGTIAFAYEKETGKYYIIRDSKKKEISFQEAVTSGFIAWVSEKDLQTIPNA